MTEDAVKRAVQSAAREAFAMGVRSSQLRGGSDRERLKSAAMQYAEDLVLPIVGMAVQEALEQQWIAERERALAATAEAS